MVSAQEMLDNATTAATTIFNLNFIPNTLQTKVVGKSCLADHLRQLSLTYLGSHYDGPHSREVFCSYCDSTLLWFSFDPLSISTIFRLLLCHCFYLFFLPVANSRHCLRLNLCSFLIFFHSFLFEAHNFSHSFSDHFYVISMSPKLQSWPLLLLWAWMSSSLLKISEWSTQGFQAQNIEN